MVFKRYFGRDGFIRGILVIMIEVKIRLRRRYFLFYVLLFSFIDYSVVVFIYFIFGIFY